MPTIFSLRVLQLHKLMYHLDVVTVVNLIVPLHYEF